jgi:hypothetical protein
MLRKFYLSCWFSLSLCYRKRGPKASGGAVRDATNPHGNCAEFSFDSKGLAEFGETAPEVLAAPAT